MSGTATISWIGNTAASTTYAKWNSIDKDADIVLSGSDLVASNVNGNNGMVRSNIGKSSGKWYWEITITAIDNSSWGIGIANSSATLAWYPGQDTNGWAYWMGVNPDEKLTNDVLSGYGSGNAATGNIVSVLLNMDAGEVSFRLQNTDVGVAFTGLTGTIYAAVGNNNALFTATANFGASPFTYTVPAGYNSGLYN